MAAILPTARPDYEMPSTGWLLPAGEAVFFTAADAGGWRVFASRGGPAVALVDADISQFVNPLGTTGVLGKRLIFSTGAGEHGATFVSDGTVAGTERISDLGPGMLLGVLGADGVVGMGSTASSALIRLAGDSNRVSRIAHWKPTYGAGSFVQAPAVGTGRALFVATDGAGLAVHSTDGTHGGTHTLARGETSECVMAQERGYFAMGTRLYSTLGTPGTTRMLRDFTPYGVRGLVGRDDELMAFFARPGADELIRVSRGGLVYQIPFSESYAVANGRPIVTETATYVLVTTSAALTSLQRNAPGAPRCEAVASLGWNATFLGRLTGRLVLLDAGTLAVYDEAARTLSRPGVSPPLLGRAFDFGDRMLWVGDAGIWSTDGTQAGSGWVTQQSFSYPTVAADLLFAVGHDAQAGAELWVSDGTLLGTVRAADIEPGPCGSGPGGLLPVGSGRQVLFAAHTSANGRALWTSDGTSAGTRLLAGLSSTSGSYLLGFAVLGPRAIYWADHPAVGMEPWTVPTGQIGAYVVRSLGGSCPGGRIPMQVVGAPRLGDASFAFVARPNPPGVGVLLLGTTIVAQSYVGCILRVGDVVAMVPGTVNGAGQLSVGVPVPNDPRVLGVTFTAQYQLSQGATLVSEAMYCTIGL